MTKQDEIKEGMLRFTTLEEDVGAIIGSWFLDHPQILKLAPQATRAIMKHLHKKGVVIKVDREVPKPIRDALKECIEMKAISAHAMSIYIRVCPLRILGLTCEQCKELAGYVAVEPLIKEAT